MIENTLMILDCNWLDNQIDYLTKQVKDISTSEPLDGRIYNLEKYITQIDTLKLVKANLKKYD